MKVYYLLVKSSSVLLTNQVYLFNKLRRANIISKLAGKGNQLAHSASRPQTTTNHILAPTYTFVHGSRSKKISRPLDR